ncbi:hypothetical protein ACFWPY_39875 [Streptomyces sp. NPDC058527]|uniref:hypothetical protein n=1 Tax=Streptomyces sp. NPDC058527 TaxID=3346539 RepID=UPI003647AC68
MTRHLFLALVLPLLAAECIAQFVLHDQELTTLSALLALAVIAIRWALGPQTAEERACPADCPKCAESESTGGED